MASRNETANQMDQEERTGAVTVNKRRKNSGKPACSICGEGHNPRQTCLRAWLTELSVEERAQFGGAEENRITE